MKNTDTVIEGLRLFICAMLFVLIAFIVPRKTKEGLVIIEVLRIYCSTTKRIKEAKP